MQAIRNCVYLNLLLLVSFVGCAHTQLRWNTTHQVRTLSEIHEQQVLDNLAKFVVDANSMPSFAYPNQGASGVTDAGNVGNSTTWNKLGFLQGGLTLGGSRSMNEAWTLTPVFDVRRLELMRCAYQAAIESAGVCRNATNCPDCDRIQRTFYVGDPAGRYNSGNDKLPDTLETFSRLSGRTTPACFQPVKWLESGDKRCLPKDCKCLKKGHYCGTYVWILPGGQDELTKLTLTILDYAFSSQATARAGAARQTKDVTWFFDTKGLPTERSNAAQEIRATVPFDKVVRLTGDNTNLPLDLEASTTEKVEAIDRVFSMPAAVEGGFALPPISPQPSGYSPLQLDLNQTFLSPQNFAPPQ